MGARSFGKAQGLSAPAPRAAQRRLRTRFLDARRHSRQRMMAPGKLYFGLTAPTLDCLIGDMSMGGARVRVRPGTIVPDSLYLIHLREWTAYKARVAWRRPDGNVGLAFAQSHDLEGASAPELRVMREFCAAFERLR